MISQSVIKPGFMVIHSNQLEDLRALVVHWLKTHPLLPLENEIFLVQSNGIAQWLKLALASDEHMQIAAATEIALPGRFLWKIYRNVLGTETIAKQSALDKAPLTWRLMRLLPTVLDNPLYAPLKRFLADDESLRKRYQLAERLADLYDQYQVYRADWLEDWEQQQAQLRINANQLKKLTAVQQQTVDWQADLWRVMLEDVGQEAINSSRAGVHQHFMQRMEQLSQAPQGLPRRVIIFGISSLPAQTVEALAAISRFTQVLLCVHNPCQHHWGDIVEDRHLLSHQYKRHATKQGMPSEVDLETLHQHAQPLLAAWGKQGRDYINLLDQHDDPEHYLERFNAINQRIDLFDPMPTSHLLGQLQDDILQLRSLSETQQQWPAINPEQDQSIQFAICHSALREIEVLHDHLLKCFNQDSTLRPRDVIVMVPNIDQYAPLIQAVFGQYALQDERFIPFTLSDQTQRGNDPLMIAVERLLHLPELRITANEVLEWLDVPAIREHFSISQAQLPLLQRWLQGAGVRWGLNQAHRQQLGLSAIDAQNSWLFGLRRMLMGYAAGDSERLLGIEPYAEVAGLEAALLGPLYEMLQALEQLLAEMHQEQTAAQWASVFANLLSQFFTASNEREAVLLQRLQQGLEQWLSLCEDAAFDQPLPLMVAREAWLTQVETDRLSQRFLAGAVNFCTLMPMRAIPFKTVCLLGMNDADYPRAPTPLDFDLMVNDYRPGDRSRREDDRYLLLEALLSAREQLYISWVGRSVRDNTELPPSVLVGQLREHLNAGWQATTQQPLVNALTTEHALQPFSTRYFAADSGYFTYAKEWAQNFMSDTDRLPSPSYPTYRTAVLEPQTVSLAQFQRFMRNPVESFLHEQLQVNLRRYANELEDTEPFALDALQVFSIKRQVLNQATARLSPEHSAEQYVQAELQRLQGQGILPLAGFAEHCILQMQAGLVEQLTSYQQLIKEWPYLNQQPKPLSYQYRSTELTGWLGGLRQKAANSSELAAIYLEPNVLKKGNNWRAHRLLNAYITHVLAAANGINLTSIIQSEGMQVIFQPEPQLPAQQQVQEWLEIWEQHLLEPLPIAQKTAFVFLEALAKEPLEASTEQAQQQAKKTYEGDGYQVTGEVQQSPALARFYPDFTALSADQRFFQLAHVLYAALHRSLTLAGVKQEDN